MVARSPHLGRGTQLKYYFRGESDDQAKVCALAGRGLSTTQGKTIEELRENLKDLYQGFASGAVPYIKKVDELVLSNET